MKSIYDRIQDAISDTPNKDLASKILTIMGEETSLLLLGIKDEVRQRVSRHLESTDGSGHDDYCSGAYRALGHLNETIDFINHFMVTDVILDD